MFTDYKFSKIVSDGETTTVTIRVYEGDYDKDGNYVRSALLGEKDIVLEGEKQLTESQAAMNLELAKDKAREPIPEQK